MPLVVVFFNTDGSKNTIKNKVMVLCCAKLKKKKRKK
jgi:hypothetical protein